MPRETDDPRTSGQIGTDRTADRLLSPEQIDGFEPAAEHLSRIYLPRRFVLHEVRFDGPNETTGRIHVGRGGNTDYYAATHDLQLLSGIKVIEGSLQAAALTVGRTRPGIPRWRAAKFAQTKAAAAGNHVDFRTKLEIDGRNLSASVDVLNEEGDVIARTTEMSGVLEDRKEVKNTEKPKEKLWVPPGTVLAAPLLNPIYNSDRVVLDLMRFGGATSGTGIIIVDQNTIYYRGNHRGDEIAEPILVHAAMQTATIIGTQGHEPGSLLPFYTGGSFKPVSDAPMGEYAQIQTTITTERGHISASADILNPDGEPIAHISGITGRIAPPGAMKRLLKVASSRTS